MLNNEINRLKIKKIKFENFEKKNPEIRNLPTNHPEIIKKQGRYKCP